MARDRTGAPLDSPNPIPLGRTDQEVGRPTDAEQLTVAGRLDPQGGATDADQVERRGMDPERIDLVSIVEGQVPGVAAGPEDERALHDPGRLALHPEQARPVVSDHI